jgi:hypothetical protein
MKSCLGYLMGRSLMGGGADTHTPEAMVELGISCV